MTKKIAVADFETDPFEYEADIYPFAWGIYDGDNYSDYFTSLTGDLGRRKCARSFLRELKRRKIAKVYMHNGGKFDFHFLLDCLEPGAQIKLINGRIATMKINEIEFVDSFLILPVPLKAFAKDEFDYKKMHRSKRGKYKKEIMRYLAHDCMYLHQLVDYFLSRFGHHLTLPTAAFQELKKSGYKIKKTTKEFDEKFREFYFGGMVRAFRPGVYMDKKLYVYDINSAYPQAMTLNHAYGHKYRVFTQYALSDDVLASDFVRVTGYSHGAFPVRTKKGLEYPSEFGCYSVTGHEYLIALKHGLLTGIEKIDIIRFDTVKNMDEYVSNFYAEKLAAKRDCDKLAELMAKLFLNASYGKFALNPEKYKQYIIHKIGVWAGTDYKLEGDTGNGYSIWSKPDPGDTYYNVATAASITGAVRAMLLEQIANKNNEIYYCDTDSLICTSADCVPVGENLGAWKIEAVFDEFYLAGKKVYAGRDIKSGEWKTASKGSQLTPEEIKRVASGEVVTWRNAAPSFSIKSGARYVKRDIRKTN